MRMIHTVQKVQQTKTIRPTNKTDIILIKTMGEDWIIKLRSKLAVKTVKEYAAEYWIQIRYKIGQAIHQPKF